ncbi:MAG TPA: capsular biosynthesis protein [Deltaproteobacteria bacterium]|nr:capsular biosynthesis protein [Deltaproteobacteria bacterium]
MIDLHAHILPDMDDGPDDWDEALAMCRAAMDDGITRLAATVHTNDGVYDNDARKIAARVGELEGRMKAAGGFDGIEIMIGAEAGISPDLADRVRDGSIPTINGKNHLLVELPFNSMPLRLEETLFALRANGILPILAHPERNRVVQDSPAALERIVRAGALVQVTASSLEGTFGKGAARCAERLLRAGLVHNIATDAHSTGGRPPVLSGAFRRAKRLIGERGARMLVEEIPAMIADGVETDPLRLKIPVKRWFFF